MHRSRVALALLAGVASCLVVLGSAAAAGSGYDLSFTQAPTTAISDVALIDLLTSDPGGSNITVTLVVDGVFVLNSPEYSYSMYFAAGPFENATAFVQFSNTSASGSYETLEGGSSMYGTVLATLSNGNSELSFSIAKAVVGNSTGFEANAAATFSSSATQASSQLGSTYGGGGSCTGVGCSPTGSGGSPFDWWIVIVPALVVVAVVAIVLVVALRRKPATPSPPPPAAPPPSPP